MLREKIRLEELLGINQGLSFLDQSTLPYRTHYWVDKVFEDVHKEFLKLEEFRKKLIEKYVCRNDKGEPVLSADKKQYEFEPEKKIEFEKEFAELGKDEIEINVYKFKPEQLGDLKLTGPMRRVLKRFLEDEVPSL